MILFLIFLILFIVPITIYYISEHYTNNAPKYPHRYQYQTDAEYEQAEAAREAYTQHWLYNFGDLNDSLLFMIGGVAGIITIVMLIFIIITRLAFPAYAASRIETQKMLEYKISAQYPRDEFGLLNKEIVDEIQIWNEDIVKYQINESNPWINIFYPKMVTKYNLHTIDLSEVR